MVRSRFSGVRGNIFSLLGILLTLIIIMFLVSRVMRANFGKPVSDKKLNEAASVEGLDTSSETAAADSALKKINAIRGEMEEKNKEFEEMNK